MSAHPPAAASPAGVPPPSPGGLPRATQAPATNVSSKFHFWIMVGIGIVLAISLSLVIRWTFFGDEEQDTGSAEATASSQGIAPAAPAPVSLDAKAFIAPGSTDSEWSIPIERPDGHTVKLCGPNQDKIRIQHKFKYELRWTDLVPGTRPSFEVFRAKAIGPSPVEVCYRFAPRT